MSDVTNMQSDIRTLLQSWGDEVGDTDGIDKLLAAECQPYIGINYKVFIDIATYHHIQIKYTIGPIVNKTEPKPTALIVIDPGYQNIVDLSQVEAYTDPEAANIRSLLSRNSDIDITDTSNIFIISAIVRNTKDCLPKYTVTMNVGIYNDIMISFVVDDDIDVQLVDAGYKTIDDALYRPVNDIQSVRLDVFAIQGDIRKLLNASLSEDIIALFASAQDTDNGWKCYYLVTLNVGSRTAIIIEYFISVPLYLDRNYSPMPEHLRVIDAGRLAGAFDDVGAYDLTNVRKEVARADADIRWLLAMANGMKDVEEDSQIIVTSAQVQRMIGKKYRVTMDVSCYVDVVIEYFIDLEQNDPRQKPMNLKFIDGGDCFMDPYQSVRNSETKTHTATDAVVIVSIILGFCLIGFMVGFVIWFVRKKKRSDIDGLYDKLTADGRDGIDVNL